MAGNCWPFPLAVFVNISAYKFTPLENLPELRQRLLASCQAAGMRGTILLSPEGINIFLSGTRGNMETVLSEVRCVPGLDDLTPKLSLSKEQPFNRMLVKIKKEIIAFGVEGIDPARHPAPKLSAKELKQWLDQGQPVTLLDTRNDYETRIGTFRGALTAGIEEFREFPNAVRKLSDELRKQPVVLFCTGGIRCEKAAPYLEREGFQNVFQLDGGILKYFEECGGAHYEGECFVFDRRVGVDSSLCETNSVMCFQCQMPLTEEEQRHLHYLHEESCPYCFGSGLRVPGADYFR